MIIGHEKNIERLEADFKGGRFAHAYLFVGEDHLGKVTVAKHMAGIIQEGMEKVDTVEVLGRDGSLKVADIRSLIERANLSRQAPYKIFIIQNIERMTREAANAFLKTLEEPPERTIFFLTCSSLESVLQTIISRVRIMRFHRVKSDIYEKLGELKFLAEGRPGKARMLLDNEEKMKEYQAAYRKVRMLVQGLDLVEKFNIADNLATEGEKVFLEVLVAYIRKCVVEGRTDAQDGVKKLCKIADTGMLLKKNVNARLALENLMLEI